MVGDLGLPVALPHQAHQLVEVVPPPAQFQVQRQPDRRPVGVVTDEGVAEVVRVIGRGGVHEGGLLAHGDRPAVVPARAQEDVIELPRQVLGVVLGR